MTKGVRIPEIAVQVVLSDSQISQGIALIVFTPILGAAIFVQVGRNVLNNRLVIEIAKGGIPINSKKLLDRGITQLVDFVPAEYRDKMMLA